MKGIFELIVTDKAGKVVDYFREENTIVNGAKSKIARLLSGDATVVHYVNEMRFGTGTVIPAVTDVGLQSPITPRKAISTVEYPSTYSVTFIAYLLTSEANGFPISEAGLFSGDGTLFARKTFSARNKTADYAFQFRWGVTT